MRLSEQIDFETGRPYVDDSGLEPGCVLNNTYRVGQLIAQGGMGKLHLASHERLPGLFVVKTPHVAVPGADEIAARLREEAKLVAGLSHPNIVKVFELNTTPSGLPYMVMEHLQGMDLNKIMRARPLQPWEAAGVVRQVASALSAAHACGIVHRDLKPENVFVVPVSGQDDLIKLIDFGASKVGSSSRITGERSLIGTPNYMSPEQINGRSHEVDARTDQFALAILTYEMLAGEAPFVGDDPLRLLYRIVNHDPPPLAGKVTWVPKAVELVLRRALEKDPDDRYPTVTDFSRALELALQKDIGAKVDPLRLLANLPAPQTGPTAARAQRAAGGRTDSLPTSCAARRPRIASPVRKRPLRGRGGRRSRRHRPLLWLVASAVAAGVALFAPQAEPIFRQLQADLAGHVENVEHFVLQTRVSGPSNTAENPGTFQPRSSDSGSTQPFPP
jgi:eukaryotic-like serine/threonine-protein kinase